MQTAHETTTTTPQEGYDHSYFFISSFMDEHLDFHARALKSGGGK